jgi:hypothetical protein
MNREGSVDVFTKVFSDTDYGHTMAKSLILCGLKSNPNKYLGCGYEGLVFCRNNGRLMENTDKGLTVSKWVLINWTKMPQMPQYLSAQIVCRSLNILDFNEKKASLGVRSPWFWGCFLQDFFRSLLIFQKVPNTRAISQIVQRIEKDSLGCNAKFTVIDFFSD